jgi:hypothetical protein
VCEVEKQKMSLRKRLDHEGLEIYLLNLFLLYRPLLRIAGTIILLYAIATLSFYPLGSIAALVVAAFFLLMTFSYSLMLHVVKLGAWLGTIRKEG